MKNDEMGNTRRWLLYIYFADGTVESAYGSSCCVGCGTACAATMFENVEEHCEEGELLGGEVWVWGEGKSHHTAIDTKQPPPHLAGTL